MLFLVIVLVREKKVRKANLERLTGTLYTLCQHQLKDMPGRN
jgi:hypothetical protein